MGLPPLQQLSAAVSARIVAAGQILRSTKNDGRLDPDQALAFGVQLGLIADAAEREGRGDRVEGGGLMAAPIMQATLVDANRQRAERILGATVAD